MDKKSILSQIKSLVFSTEEEVVEQVFLDAKTTDGLIVRVEGEAFVKEALLRIVSEDGEFPAEAGSYTLENGTVIETAEGGLIINVTEAEVELEEETAEIVELEEEEEEEVVVEEELEEDNKEEEYKIEDLIKRMGEIEEMIKKMSESNEKVEEFSKIVSDKIDSFIKDTPAQLEFKSIKTEYKSTIDNKRKNEVSNIDKIQSLRKK